MAPGAVGLGVGLSLALSLGMVQGRTEPLPLQPPVQPVQPVQSVPPLQSVTPIQSVPPVQPVAAVNLERYAGGWYEIARIPNRFQRACARHSTAHYRLLSDGDVAVLNQCLRRSGGVEEARGVARVIDRASNARLKVSLVSFLGWRPFWGAYWVIGLAPDYRWAVVGSPDRRYGWLLARTPQLTPAELSAAREAIERNGYSWDRFALGDTRLTP